MWANLGWAPLKEELLYRALLQAKLARFFQRLVDGRPILPEINMSRGSSARSSPPPPTPLAPSSEDSVRSTAVRLVGEPKRAARLVSSVAFGLAHLPSTPQPQAWVVELPTAVAAGLSSFFCFGRLFDARGLPAAVGAHAAHNAFVAVLLLLRISEGRQVAGAFFVPRLGLLVPTAIYALAILSWRRRVETRSAAA